MSHPMIAHAAATCDFGSDDGEAKHMLLFEVGGSVYFGRYGAVQRLLTKINEHLVKTARELMETLESIERGGLNGFRQAGGFESLLGATRENEALGGQIVRELEDALDRCRLCGQEHASKA